MRLLPCGLCPSRIQFLGGDVTVTSEPGKGSVFTVRLRASPARCEANWASAVVSRRIVGRALATWLDRTTWHEDFTPPLASLMAPKKTNLALETEPTHTVNLFVVNDRSPGDRSTSISIGELGVGDKDWFVLKFFGPTATFSGHTVQPSPLMAELLKVRPNNTIGICAASDLRKSGAPISRGLSWERTVSDVIDGIRNRRILDGILPQHLIITFDYDATLYLKINPPNDASGPTIEHGWLVFSVEGAVPSEPV